MTQYLSQRVGKNLKNLIKVSKYKTQDNFASVMNVDPTTVRRWIALGVKDVNTIEEIANKLDIDFMELFN
ncbi:MAG: helix-turn-helix transcriptional regulator [Erysipelotrichaceae bacterium]|nr:helix-turn-helix transcriptional regulator [Erysipelotrichaceae bacterium]